MAAVVVLTEDVTIPGWIDDLESFTRWTDSPDFPEAGRYSFIDGAVWMDTSIEQPFTHNLVKLWISIVLATIGRDKKLGTFFTDRMRLRNDLAGFSTEPDGLFVSHTAMAEGRVRLVEGSTTDYREFEGAPDMVLEVVSDSSVTKDRVDLRAAYFAAGIDEYWLVDARDAELEFAILRRGKKGYVECKAQAGGWVRSAVFGRSFRLVRTLGPDGHPQFTLEHRR